MKVLCVLCNPKPLEESYSKKMAMKFIEEYKKNNENSEVDILDLYKENFQSLSYETLQEAQFDRCGKMVDEAERFAEYDKYIIAAPMWNLSVPSILKSYIDHIISKGITFRYSKNGMPIGLLKNKKAVYLGTRGGYYPFPLSLFAFDLKYVKYVFRFMGIKNFDSIMLQNVDKKPNDRERNFEKISKKIEQYTKTF